MGHGIELGGHGCDDALRCLAVPLAARELEYELTVRVLVRGVLVVQLFERLKLSV